MTNSRECLLKCQGRSWRQSQITSEETWGFQRVGDGYLGEPVEFGGIWLHVIFGGWEEHRVQVVKDRIWTENNVWETRSVGHQGSCEVGGWGDTKGEEASWKALDTCDKFNDMIIFYEKDEAPPIVSDQPLTINFPTKRQSQANTND